MHKPEAIVVGNYRVNIEYVEFKRNFCPPRCQLCAKSLMIMRYFDIVVRSDGRECFDRNDASLGQCTLVQRLLPWVTLAFSSRVAWDEKSASFVLSFRGSRAVDETGERALLAIRNRVSSNPFARSLTGTNPFAVTNAQQS